MPSDALAALAERNDPEHTLVALTMLRTLLANAKQDGDKYGSIKSSSKALASKVLQCEGGAAALECISFRLQDDAYVFGASADEPPEDAAAVLAVFEAARTALLQLGDENVPDAAMAALKLVCIYAQNVVDAPDDASKRRVNAANKALQSRVLSASGGRALLAAVGFEERAGGEAGGEAVFACEWADARLLRVALGVLKRASDVWSAEAARTLGAPDAQAGAAEAKAGAAGGTAGAAAAAAAAAAPAEAVAGFNIRQLPPASRLSVPGAADMQPVLVLGEGEPRHTHMHRTCIAHACCGAPSTLRVLWHTIAFRVCCITVVWVWCGRWAQRRAAHMERAVEAVAAAGAHADPLDGLRVVRYVRATHARAYAHARSMHMHMHMHCTCTCTCTCTVQAHATRLFVHPAYVHCTAGGLRMDVDLGDGTVLPLEAAVANDAIENEYQSAKRFIDDHPEQLDNNYLEEIARNIRTLAAPVMQTVQNLKAAMEAQN